MKSQDFFHFFRPLYVLLAGMLGGGILAILFSPYFPVHCKNSEIGFFCVPEFSVMFFLMGILWSLMAISLSPGWGTFHWLLRKHIARRDTRFRSQVLIRLIMLVMIIAVMSYVIFKSLGQFNPEAQARWNVDVPEGVQRILLIHSIYFLIAILPYLLGMFILSALIREIGVCIHQIDIDINKSEAESAVQFINPLLLYRRMLQLFLLVSGIMLSMFPLVYIVVRSIIITIDPPMGNLYPASYVIFQGLIFSMLLLFIYVPAFLELTVVGRHLREVLCPLNSLSNLRDTVEKRKILDNLLQTEGSFITNVGSSILTLSPLISSFLILLGVKV
jgi:hypothetical protein